jgi:hypothetical protein
VEFQAQKKGVGMTRCYGLLVALFLFAGPAMAQNTPILDKVAATVISNYQNATCEQLIAKKRQPHSEMAQRAVVFLRNNPGARIKFINMVAAPIANKMFECGMIP